jgi:hypothetical protein
VVLATFPYFHIPSYFPRDHNDWDFFASIAGVSFAVGCIFSDVKGDKKRFDSLYVGALKPQMKKISERFELGLKDLGSFVTRNESLAEGFPDGIELPEIVANWVLINLLKPPIVEEEYQMARSIGIAISASVLVGKVNK